MSAATVSFIKDVVKRSPLLLPLMAEHLKDHNGDIIPHLLMGDITRVLLTRVRDFGCNDEAVARVLQYYEEVFGERDRNVDELIAVSFLENLPRPDESGSELRRILGPRLYDELCRLDGKQN